MCKNYIAVICKKDVLYKRLTINRHYNEQDEYVKASMDFNEWQKENAGKTSPPMKLLDNTRLTASEAAAAIDNWICEHIKDTTSQDEQSKHLSIVTGAFSDYL
ncbi:MAG: hypothetical protein Q8930_13760 [Bacillota bacterium]|nr:hypothetical protein [Bacillota bacterium]